MTSPNGKPAPKAAQAAAQAGLDQSFAEQERLEQWRECLHECLARAHRYATIAALHVELGDDAAAGCALKSLAACVRASQEIFDEPPRSGSAGPGGGAP